MRSSKQWLVPLTGVLFVAVAIAAFAIGGEPPEAKKGGEKIIQHYIDNKDSIEVSALLIGIAGILFVFFWGYVRRVLRDAEGPEGMLSALVLVGATIFVAGITFDATLAFGLAEAAKHLQPAAAQAIEAIWDNDFMPIAAGSTILMLAAGLSIVRHGALPKWLGWVAILLAIVSITPLGFAGFLGTAVWIVIVSILLAVRGRRDTAAPAAAAG